MTTLPTPSFTPRSQSRAAPITIHEALNSVLTSDRDDERPPRRLTFSEAILHLRPESDYTLEEALSSLDPDEYDADSSSDDSDTISFILTPSERSDKSNGSRSHRIIKDISQYLKKVGLWQYSTMRLSLSPIAPSGTDDGSAHQSLHQQLAACFSSPILLRAGVGREHELGTKPLVRDVVVIYIIALQLLASTMTASQPSLPAALYLGREARLKPEMISALRMHTIMSAYNPAAGHHMRQSSPAPVWPGLLERDREEILAEEVTRRRLERIKEKLDGSSSENGAGRIPNLIPPPPSQYQVHQARPPFTFLSSHQAAPVFAASTVNTYPSPPSSPSPMYRRLQRSGNYDLHPVIRMVPHPVFIQPVKEFAIHRKRGAAVGNRWSRLRERERLMRGSRD